MRQRSEVECRILTKYLNEMSFYCEKKYVVTKFYRLSLCNGILGIYVYIFVLVRRNIDRQTATR